MGLIIDIYLGNAKFKKEAIDAGSIKRKGRPRFRSPGREEVKMSLEG